MNSPRFTAGPASPVLPSFDYTRLPDIELYKSGASSTSMSEVAVDPVWSELIEALAEQNPDVSRRNLALGLFSVYAARMSEGGHVAFPLGVRRSTTEPHEFFPSPFTLASEDCFESALAKIGATVSQQTDFHWQRTATLPEQNVSYLVTLGSAPDPHAAADLHIHCNDDGTLRIWHAGSVRPDAVARIVERMIALAEGILSDPDVQLIHQTILSARERKLVVQDWNTTDKHYGFDGGLVAMMERAVAATPGHPALVYMDATISFEEFNARVNRLARLLKSKGVEKDSFVCLCMDRSLELVVAIWATLKAGGAYVPLNVEDPATRINEIIDDCRPKVLLTQEHAYNRLDTETTEIMTLPAGGDIDPQADGSDLGTKIGPEDLAYMIYTSGSTGKPKGVVVEHAAIHNRIIWMHEEYGLLPCDRVLQKTPYTFDVSVWEFLWPFSVGSTLVVAEPGGHTAISYLYGLIRDSGVTHLHFVPSVLRLFLMAPDLEQLPIKKLFCSGEALGADLVQSFYQKANENAEIHNLYGPTEAAVDVSYYACPRHSNDNIIPIGRPVTNTGLYVLDELDQPVPVGVPGELHIGGVQLARGYWAREELTAERFIPCPLKDAPHDRLYRTGDLAFFRPDGQIIYLGRNDFQVKVNGVRIELGEVEAAIRDQSGVKDVVVMPEEHAGSKRLIAYVVASAPSPSNAERLQAGVAATRPASYVPKEVRFIAEMPLTTSGKINRKVLAAQRRLGTE